MSEIFDIIVAVNRLKDQVKELASRIDSLCKNPSAIAFAKYVDEAAACKILNLSSRELRKMRCADELTFIRFHRRIMYPVESLNQYLEKMTVKRNDAA